MKTLGSNIDLSIYEHPYKDEILATAPQVLVTKMLLCNFSQAIHVKPENPEASFLPLDETPLTIVKTELSLNLMITELKNEAEIAIDLEHHSYRSFLGFTCLMQISTRKADFIVDTLELR